MKEIEIIESLQNKLGFTNKAIKKLQEEIKIISDQKLLTKS